MSTTTIATADIGGYPNTSTATRDTAAPKGFFQRLFDAMVASRQAEANRLVAQHIAKMSEQERKDLGYPAPTAR